MVVGGKEVGGKEVGGGGGGGRKMGWNIDLSLLPWLIM